MKNLVVFNESVLAFESRFYPGLKVVDGLFDAISDTITCVMSDASNGVFEIQRMNKNGLTQPLGYFENPCPGSQLKSLKYFEDENLLVLVLSNGDIILGHIGDSVEEFSTEIIGSMDDEVAAAEWSPDDEILVIVTINLKMTLISRSFEPTFTADFSEIDSEGLSSGVSVGWGKSETQFQGKGFKALEREQEALRDGMRGSWDRELNYDPTLTTKEEGALSLTDEGEVCISWRDDCDVFAVSSISQMNDKGANPRRLIRFFQRTGKFEAASESVNALDACLSWRSQGALLASTRSRFDEQERDNSEVIFFERNGLRHGGFRVGHERILNLAWSCDGEVLAVICTDRIQFWTTKNYHWYLKQECYHERCTVAPIVRFHPEKPLVVLVANEFEVKMLSLGRALSDGVSSCGADLGLVSVIDGRKVKITPLAVTNIPPPMSLLEVDHPEAVKSVSLNQNLEVLTALTGNSNFYLTPVPDIGEPANHRSQKLSIERHFIESDRSPKQVCLTNSGLLFVLADSATASFVYIFDVKDACLYSILELPQKTFIIKLSADGSNVIAEQCDGGVLKLTSEGFKKIAQFPQFCGQMEAIITDSHEIIVVGLSDTGKLFHNERILASGITSFKLTDQFLCVTTAQSRLCFVHLNSMTSADLSYISKGDHDDERLRQIERGSVLVSVAPSRYSVILQAQRGNLETIYPRIMVLTAVRAFIKEKQYDKAFFACRSHRIDLDIIHDYDADAFERNISLFVQQVKNVEFLDLFISCLRPYDVTREKYSDTFRELSEPFVSNEKDAFLDSPVHSGEQSKINRICNILMKELKKEVYQGAYLQSEITALACQSPPNDDGALTLISRLSNSQSQEEALTHLCYLRDSTKLFDKALGLYEVHLALQIAQKSQLDPKEYLPFLQRLHGEETRRRNFVIDDYLKRFDLALGWLHKLGEDAEKEFDNYMVNHALYKVALGFHQSREERRLEILELYAVFLSGNAENNEAGKIFEYLGNEQLALENYLLARRWKEALFVAQSIKTEPELKAIANKLSLQLEEERNFCDAARIELDFLDNSRRAVKLYCKAYDFDSALLVARSCKDNELEEIVDTKSREAFGIISELLADCNGQVISQLKRLREIRQKKDENPSLFYGYPSPDVDTPDDVSIAASELSTTPSFFTRYTDKSNETARTGASRRTSKNRKREERKRAKGRKGTIYEEEYLIKSVARLIERLNSTVSDVESLINFLLRRRLWTEASQIQTSWTKIMSFLDENVQEIFAMSEKDRERFDENGNSYLASEIPIPKINNFTLINVLQC